MAQRAALSLGMAGVLLCCTLAAAKPAPQPATPPALLAESQSVAHVTLGQSAVPLYGPWRFTVGDSPIDPKTGQPLWAEPDFDDSKWEAVDLTPKDGASSSIGGLSGYVPGWTAKGHPGYFGYAWYRIRVQVRARHGERLAVAGPANVDDAYQLFDNGALAGHFGDFTGDKPVVYAAQPKMFPLAQLGSNEAITGEDKTGLERAGQGGTISADSTRVLAFRLWMEPYTLTMDPEVGGMHSAPVLGEAGAVAAGYQMRWLELIRAYASSVALALLFGLLSVLAFSLILFDRSDRVYLWMGTLFLLIAFSSVLSIIQSWTELLNSSMINLLRNGLAQPLISAAWVMVFWVWFGLKRPPWMPRLTAVLTLLLGISFILGDEDFYGLVPHGVAVQFVTVTLALRVLFFALLLWVVVKGIRQQGVEGWLVLPVAVLWGVSAFRQQLGLLHIRTSWHPFGAQVTLSTFSNLLVAVVIALLLLRRLLQSVRRQRLMALDVKQAQEVQQVILPESRVKLAGLIVESEYLPAREVGGDFFQIIPLEGGSTLVILGDVSGKGLKAAMAVSLIVGAARMVVDFTSSPAEILAGLNRRLCGRLQGGFATCIAMRLDRDGNCAISSAGHPAPFLNKHEMNLPGALPLGIQANTTYEETMVRVGVGDHFALYTDGLLEARSESGELYSFARLETLFAGKPNAAEATLAAVNFGQDDDITVLTLTRLAVGEESTAQHMASRL